MDKAAKRLKRLEVFTFFLAPVFAWGSVIASDETAVFASLSRMIWYSGSSIRIFIAMAVMFIPMLISFFHAHAICGITQPQKVLLRICMIVSCAVLYVGNQQRCCESVEQSLQCASCNRCIIMLLPDLLPSYLSDSPKGQGRRAPARRLSGLFSYYGRLRGAERF